MSKKLMLSGRVLATKGKQPVELGPGADVVEVALPDKTYGLTAKDVERIVQAGVGVVVSADPKEADKAAAASAADPVAPASVDERNDPQA